MPEEFKGRDEILGEAGLSGQIGGGTEDEATTGSSVYVPADKAEDTQLQYAIKLIEGTEIASLRAGMSAVVNVDTKPEGSVPETKAN